MKHSIGQVFLSDLFDLGDNNSKFYYDPIKFDQEFNIGDKLVIYYVDDFDVLLITDMTLGFTTFLARRITWEEKYNSPIGQQYCFPKNWFDTLIFRY